ncbi:MAG: MBOAT family O-acyltransferase [Huintestinicola sp.]
MVFSDIFFLFEFLPVFLIAYYAARKPAYQNIVLIIFSLIFYAWGEPVWVLLLLFTSVWDFLNGLFISKHQGQKIAVLGVVCSVAADLSILAVFKYSGLIVSGINSLIGTSFDVPSFHLPIGISFYTFQSISYTVDVYRGKAKAQKNYFGFLLYLSMFFQLVAGPIVRYSTVAREIESRSIRISEFNDGLTRLIFGLGKKVIIANSMGQLASSMLDFSDAPASTLAAWAGVLLYSLQIYYDFSGYSDMAIGLGLMCGFHFNENFEHPYISTSATEFWRRWHISLGTFFRDYLYIPLGGNRKHQILNLAIVWFCTGLWHGASVNFILWGLYFGVLVVIEKLFLLKILEKIPAFFRHIYLILAVMFGWMIFYYTDMTKMGKCFFAMFGIGTDASDIVTESAVKGSIWLILAALLICTPIYSKISAKAKKIAEGSGVGFITVSLIKTVFLLAVFAVSAIMLVGDTYNPFLYFRF